MAHSRTGSSSVSDRSTPPTQENGVHTRRLAIEALERIETDEAYANLLLPGLLEDSGLDERDRGLVTELVYGATRMKRALDYLVDRFVDRDTVDPRVRAALRVGAYQIEFLRVPSHAAVDATVSATPKRARGFVNAILRKVAAASSNGETDWPTEGIRLSYPDWMLDRLAIDLGDRSTAVLEAMNQPAQVHVRDDGYRQDLASQAVAALVDPRGIVLDLCAAPGGKATAVAAAGDDAVTVIGADLHEHRAGLVRSAAIDTGSSVHVLVADAKKPPFRSHAADVVLIDAPCSGLGSLRRRADARWRITPSNVSALAELQFRLIQSAAELAKPGGQIVFSVCTLTASESVDIDARVGNELPHLVPMPLPEPWEPWGRGGRLLPDTFPGDGMAAFRYQA